MLLLKRHVDSISLNVFVIQSSTSTSSWIKIIIRDTSRSIKQGVVLTLFTHLAMILMTKQLILRQQKPQYLQWQLLQPITKQRIFPLHSWQQYSVFTQCNYRVGTIELDVAVSIHLAFPKICVTISGHCVSNVIMKKNS